MPGGERRRLEAEGGLEDPSGPFATEHLRPRLANEANRASR